MIYVVMIDASKLTEPQNHRLLDEILRLGNGASEVVGDLRDTVPPVPLKYNVVEAPFEEVRERVGGAIDSFYADAQEAK